MSTERKQTIGLLLAALTLVASFMVPDVRRFFGLEKEANSAVPQIAQERPPQANAEPTATPAPVALAAPIKTPESTPGPQLNEKVFLVVLGRLSRGTVAGQLGSKYVDEFNRLDKTGLPGGLKVELYTDAGQIELLKTLGGPVSSNAAQARLKLAAEMGWKDVELVDEAKFRRIASLTNPAFFLKEQ